MLYTTPKRSSENQAEYWELTLDQQIPVKLVKKTVKHGAEKDTLYSSYHAEFPDFSFTMLQNRERKLQDDESIYSNDLVKFYKAVRKASDTLSVNKIVVRPDTVFWTHYSDASAKIPDSVRVLPIIKDGCHIFDGEGQKQIVLKCADLTTQDSYYQFYIGRVQMVDPQKDIIISVQTDPEERQDVKVMFPY